ncbi:MAG TPA: hypothetical protein VJ843_03535 [Candidatus Saccharimonadales bacterium]|nr:hypothetical protein [Candidatus Saccharimonadales bacterium]
MSALALRLSADTATTLAVIAAIGSLLMCALGIALAASRKTEVKRRGKIIITFLVVAWIGFFLIWKALHE